MYDYHVHSSFSGDCKYSMEDMVKGALEKNIKAFCFTDHIDYDYGNDELDFVFDKEDYFKELKRIRSNYKGQIDILSGIELGMQPHLVRNIHEKMSLEDFDFIIMSIHTVMGKEIHEGELFQDRDLLDAYFLYYDEMLEVLDKFNDFDVVGHINLIDRYVKHMNNKTVRLEEYKEFIEKVLKKIIDKDKGIEINTSGIRYGINSFLPTVEILSLYKELGGEIVTIGSDAHSPEYVGSNYEEAVELLRTLNYKYITTFKNRKKQFIKIE
ncbi:histidinol-phosphatase HisJ family protein [Proteiniborus sp. MB09-C3]|uniref:histidinol-phosphatase HisJ family protein n=1 Tax=Proteiniborus sp. MB09-C3 TaxID=3050072 RepID=UPI00255299F4|nr:histidinol-phosphatase HisJ family protein [Proteiniborus sp. MB09-C3]WIV10486.1 histidinol-phosphatase HisJ family protein [Proteiniborus sp. MB09-C3]